MKINATFIHLLAPLPLKTTCTDAMACLRVEPHEENGAWLVALNGHSMGVFHDETAEDVREFLFVPSKALISACKALRGVDRTLEIDDLGNAKVMSGLVPVYVEPRPVSCSDQYPDWRRIFGKQVAPVERIGVNPKDIRHFEGLGSLVFDFTGAADGPIYVSSPAYKTFKGATMPMKLTQDVEDF